MKMKVCRKWMRFNERNQSGVWKCVHLENVLYTKPNTDEHAGTLAGLSIMSFNIWDQQYGIHLPPVWEFLLRPYHLAETWLGIIQNQPHSDTSNTLVKHTAASCKQIRPLQGQAHQTCLFCSNSASHSFDEFYMKTMCTVPVFVLLGTNS